MKVKWQKKLVGKSDNEKDGEEENNGSSEDETDDGNCLNIDRD